MVSQNGEHKTGVISTCSFMLKMIEKLNDMVSSRISR